MSRIKEQYEYLQWQIQSLTNDLQELGQRMDDRQQIMNDEQQQQESNNGR
jgi:prefoldin subunit 5